MTSVTNALSHDATVLAFVHLIPRARLQLSLLLPYGAAKERIFRACCFPQESPLPLQSTVYTSRFCFLMTRLKE
ncbi:MAG: hypothetical protein ABS948_10945 [Solibacillus sp.]